ncbi:MAG: hypothetical protein RLZ56_763 [Bacteroidota bacterium]|jgi:hypothetical protein
MKYLSILLFSLFLFACSSEKKHVSLIPINTMKVVVWQLMQVDELYSRKTLTDSSWKREKKNIQFYQQIFNLNKVDRGQFFDEMKYLQTHPIEFKELMDSVEALSKREKNEALKH